MEQQTEELCRPADGETPAGEKKVTQKSFRWLRFETGLAVLFAAMGAMIALVLLDVFFSMRGTAELSLVSSAFEAFKLIAVTVLGYIFGANQTKTGTGE